MDFMLKYQKINLTQSNQLSFDGEIDAGLHDQLLIEISRLPIQGYFWKLFNPALLFSYITCSQNKVL